MVEDQGSLPTLVQEYQEVADNLSISSLLSDMEKMKTTLIDDLTAYHKDFIPLSSRISDVRKHFQDITNSVRQLDTTVKSNGTPMMTAIPSTPLEGLPARLPPSELHAAAVDKLQEMLELQASCQYLLDVHTALERLEDRTACLFRRVGCFTRSACLTKFTNLHEELMKGSESLVGANGWEVGGGDENLLEMGDPYDNFDCEVTLVAASLLEVEELLSKPSYFNKSEVTVFQNFERAFVSQKNRLHDFLRSQWQRIVRISADSPSFELPVALEFNQQWVLCTLEVSGRITDIETILRLADGLKETKALVEKLCLDVWSRIFLPYLESQKTQETSTTGCLQLRTSSASNDTDEDMNGRSPVWKLSLVAIKPDIEWGDNGTKVIEDVCSSLIEALSGLSQRLFGLTVNNSTSSRIVDCCRPLGIFNECLATHLLDDLLLTHLPVWSDIFTSKEFSAVAAPAAAATIAHLSQFISRVSTAVNGLLDTAKKLGFMPSEAPGATSSSPLTSFLEHMETFIAAQGRYLLHKSVLDILSKTENFYTLHKMDSSKRIESPSAEDEEAKLSVEDIIEQEELTELFSAVDLDFPACSVSEAAVSLLARVNQIIDHAEALLNVSLDDSGAKADDTGLDPAKTESTPLDLVRSLLTLVPRLIFLYIHSVPALHSNRLKCDFKFLAVYYDDCIYLAHECLTLGKLRLYPLAERFLKSTEAADGHDKDFCLPSLASFSTIQLVSQLREAGTSVLLERLREQRTLIEEQFKLSRGLRESATSGLNDCQQAVLSCLSLILRMSKELDIMPMSVYLRCLGVLCEGFVKLICQALLQLEDITTPDCSTLIQLITTTIKSISGLFEKHLDDAFASQNMGSSVVEEKSLMTLLNRRIPSWSRLENILSVLQAASLEHVRHIWADRNSDAQSPPFRLTAVELGHLVIALYKDSSARSNFLKNLTD
uniref:ZW10 C-terminal helical domain-containing protein n=2 Tax=Schistocephalus solidus TaxID=70667 RepID=A0A0V0J9B0_SCHSO